MTSHDSPSDSAHRSATWYCVLDLEWRLIYLGTDSASAAEQAVPGTVVRSAARMGDAMQAAALAVGRLAPRRGEPERPEGPR